VDFQAVPVLELYPPAASPLPHTTRPRSLVTQLANALDENTINANTIKKIRIGASLHKSREFCGVPRLIENTTRKLGQQYAYKDWQRQAADKIAIRRQSRPTNFILGLFSAYRQARQRALSSLENQLVTCARSD
jgi:hypothetical protein